IAGTNGNSGLAAILNQPLPLVNKSLSQMLDVAQAFADKVTQILQNPAGAIQQLNNILAAALGLTVPAIAVAEVPPPGDGSHDEHQTVTLNNVTGGDFTLTLPAGDV